MKFTRIHWILSCLITLLATVVFMVIALESKQEVIFFSFSFVCGVYALFSFVKAITFRTQRYLSEEEDEVLYKTSCVSCGEPLAGHELYCPKCGMFLPKQSVSEEDMSDV